MSKNMIKWTLGLLAVGCMLAMAGPAGAELTRMDSLGFDWRYEMAVMPDTENLDPPNTTMDFHEGGSGASVSDGKLTINTTKAASNYFRSNGDLEIWRYQGFSYVDGYTFEARFKIISQVTGATDGVIALHAVPADSHQRSYINLWENKITWGTSTQTTLDTNDNKDGFHIIRVAQVPTTTPDAEVFHVWRDNVLLADDLGGVLYASGYLNRMMFGDMSSAGGGNVEIDYFRFTEGAYAPIPEPATLVLLAGALLALLVWRRR